MTGTKKHTASEIFGFDLSIHEIEKLTESQAETLAEMTTGDRTEIKEHNIYFVDFGGRFGYSVLVYKNNHHIYYANDYQLHHQSRAKEELRNLYIEYLNYKLYTESEISEPIKDYDDYTAKSHYLRNYYPMQEDYVSIFFIGTEAEREEHSKQYEGKIYNPAALGYFAADKQDFVNRNIELVRILEAQKEKMTNNFEYLKQAFLSEMYNHEYGYNWQADYDVLGCFGNIHYNNDDDLEDYFNQLKFTDTQRNAYRAARKEYYKHFEG